MKILLSLMIAIFAFAKVDINHASSSDFQSLKGIGAKKAEAILNYREAHGCFSDIGDITKVSGIGNSTFEAIKEELEVIACAKTIEK